MFEYLDLKTPLSFFDTIGADEALGVFTKDKYLGAIYRKKDRWFVKTKEFNTKEEAIQLGLLDDYVSWYGRRVK